NFPHAGACGKFPDRWAGIQRDCANWHKLTEFSISTALCLSKGRLGFRRRCAYPEILKQLDGYGRCFVSSSFREFRGLYGQLWLRKCASGAEASMLVA